MKSLLYIKKEIIELKNDLKNVKNGNFNLKQEILLFKIDKQLNNEPYDSEPDDIFFLSLWTNSNWINIFFLFQKHQYQFQEEKR